MHRHSFSETQQNVLRRQPDCGIPSNNLLAGFRSLGCHNQVQLRFRQGISFLLQLADYWQGLRKSNFLQFLLPESLDM